MNKRRNFPTGKVRKKLPLESFAGPYTEYVNYYNFFINGGTQEVNWAAAIGEKKPLDDRSRADLKNSNESVQGSVMVYAGK